MRETDISIYGTQGDALERARELNAKEKNAHIGGNRHERIKNKPICRDCITE